MAEDMIAPLQANREVSLRRDINARKSTHCRTRCSCSGNTA